MNLVKLSGVEPPASLKAIQNIEGDSKHLPKVSSHRN
jgi:hypothetical protein